MNNRHMDDDSSNILDDATTRKTRNVIKERQAHRSNKRMRNALNKGTLDIDELLDLEEEEW